MYQSIFFLKVMLGCYFLYQKTASMHAANENILLYFLSKKQIVFCFDQDGPHHSLWPLMACVFVTWNGDSDGLQKFCSRHFGNLP